MKVKNYSVLFLLSSLLVINDIATAENSQSSWSFKDFGTLAATQSNRFFQQWQQPAGDIIPNAVNVMSVGI
ncbi:MAG: hypothetical protein WCK96_04470 [Methylococcales bacterium]